MNDFIKKGDLTALNPGAIPNVEEFAVLKTSTDRKNKKR